MDYCRNTSLPIPAAPQKQVITAKMAKEEKARFLNGQNHKTATFLKTEFGKATIINGKRSNGNSGVY